MKGKWKIILIAFFMLPMVVFFPGCSCGKEPDTTTQIRTDITYTVRFYTNSEDVFNIASQTVGEGQLVREPDTPKRTGYRFIGWFKDKELTQIWTFALDTVYGDMTLYAKWQKRD